MSQGQIFPEILIKKSGNKFEGLIGIRLTSILKGDLLIFSEANQEDNIP